MTEEQSFWIYVGVVAVGVVIQLAMLLASEFRK